MEEVRASEVGAPQGIQIGSHSNLWRGGACRRKIKKSRVAYYAFSPSSCNEAPLQYHICGQLCHAFALFLGHLSSM